MGQCKGVVDQRNIHKHIVILFLFLSSSIAGNVFLVSSSFHCQKWFVGSGSWPLVSFIGFFFLSQIKFLRITSQNSTNDKAAGAMKIFGKGRMH